ncbi:TetR/AcrR family transcriptional regulator [Microbacterium radiodurans]|uniref:TetR/AcrR family transcriptional regulator n=1 Tax=Microbacterium radiodurans TaxID=661398 RepID=A0A5J5IRE6_9MICO|nr:TetR/AcrR family transcriptional regulator [Microbacterium radiodurans]KAA9085011.1 TetR/AcrR family transcriptional regulator [Microbacterium radiodurans]
MSTGSSVSDAPRTARERRREQTRRELVEAARAIIDDDGVDAVSIERLVAAAGVARATVYAHFPEGRDEVLRAAYDETGRVLLAHARASAADLRSWQDRVLHYARTMIEFSASPTTGRFYSVSGPALVGFREAGGAGSRGYREDIASFLEQARTDGDLRADADPAALAVLLSSSLRDAGIAAATDPSSAERYIAAVGLILDGLRTTAAARSGR